VVVIEWLIEWSCRRGWAQPTAVPRRAGEHRVAGCARVGQHVGSMCILVQASQVSMLESTQLVAHGAGAISRP
jgi:hypothetical protein